MGPVPARLAGSRAVVGGAHGVWWNDPVTAELPPPPAADDRALVAALATDLAGVGVDEVGALLGPLAGAALHREQPAAALATTRLAVAAGDPLAALTRAFVLGAPAPRGLVDRALPRTGVAGAVRLGLLRASGEGPEDDVVGAVDLRPMAVLDDVGRATWWVASDLGSTVTHAPLAPDHVLGVGGASLSLARLTVRRPVGRTLDLGTGCGVQALHAARHSASVVATDLSSRALAFARFNAALAGVDLDLRQGSLLEPVHGERFDLVVSNPPFVITPRRPGDADGRYTYRDGGMAGDSLVASLVAGLGEVLAPGGVAQLLGNWEHRRGEGWSARVGSWLDASGLDGWVVQREVLDPAEYAETWLRDGGESRDRDPAAWDAAVGAWLEDLTARGVDAVGLGFVVLRRPLDDAPGRACLRRLEEQHGPVAGPLGAHVADVLAAHDLLSRLDDAALLATRLVVAPDVTEERHLRPGEEGPRVVLLRQGGGFGRVVDAGTALAGLVGACDGELAVGQLVGGLAALLEVPADALAAELLPQVRALVADAMLLPA